MDPWSQLRRLTSARIALGRSGGSLPTRERLDFQLAHARARDAVLSPFDPDALAARISPLSPAPVLALRSAAADRAEYLRRPDLGRKLAPESLALVARSGSGPFDLALVLSDGLSTYAAETQCEPLLAAFLPLANASAWRLAPLMVVRHARVALQDEVGALLRARVSLILIGERPGLGSADSLSAYFTYQPGPGRVDADRNCISNIRNGGLPIAEAAWKLHHLIANSLRLGLSGVKLKDDSVPRLDSGNVQAPLPMAQGT